LGIAWPLLNQKGLLFHLFSKCKLGDGKGFDANLDSG
jgi:hypothetical protein